MFIFPGDIIFIILIPLAVLSEFHKPATILAGVGFMLMLICWGLDVFVFIEYSLFIVIGEMAGAGMAVVGVVWAIKHALTDDLIIHPDSQDIDVGYVSTESDMSLLNCEGTVLTMLRPAGTIMVGDKRVDAVSDGTFIEKNKRVQVVQVNGSRVVVEEIVEV